MLVGCKLGLQAHAPSFFGTFSFVKSCLHTYNQWVVHVVCGGTHDYRCRRPLHCLAMLCLAPPSHFKFYTHTHRCQSYSTGFIYIYPPSWVLLELLWGKLCCHIVTCCTNISSSSHSLHTTALLSEPEHFSFFRHGLSASVLTLVAEILPP